MRRGCARLRSGERSPASRILAGAFSSRECRATTRLARKPDRALLICTWCGSLPCPDLGIERQFAPFLLGDLLHGLLDQQHPLRPGRMHAGKADLAWILLRERGGPPHPLAAAEVVSGAGDVVGANVVGLTLGLYGESTKLRDALGIAAVGVGGAGGIAPEHESAHRGGANLCPLGEMAHGHV